LARARRIASNIAKLTPFSVACADSGTPRARAVCYAPRAFQIGGFSMQKIDYAKLLGFAAVSDQLSEGVDFQDETISAKLGAKVGAPEVTESANLTEIKRR
jgi:hypothetical protein